MFDDVVSYTDFVVGSFKRWDDGSTGWTIVDLIAVCPELYQDHRDGSLRRRLGGGAPSHFVLCGGGPGADAAGGCAAGAVGGTGCCVEDGRPQDQGNSGGGRCCHLGLVGSALSEVAGVDGGSSGSVLVGTDGGGGGVSQAVVVDEAAETRGLGVDVGVLGGGVQGSGKAALRRAKRLRRRARASTGSCSVSGGVPEWRKGAVAVGDGPVGGRPSSPAGGFQGYFSGSSVEVRSELRDSRAKVLVLENKRRALLCEREIRRLESPAQVVSDVVGLVRRAASLSVGAGSPRVMGWAKTVLSSCAESVAGSLPSTVPSLDSVGMESTSGGSGEISDRAAEYKVKYDEMVAHYDSLEVVDPYDRDDDFAELRSSYADVFGDHEGAVLHRLKREFPAAALASGIRPSQVVGLLKLFERDGDEVGS